MAVAYGPSSIPYGGSKKCCFLSDIDRKFEEIDGIAVEIGVYLGGQGVYKRRYPFFWMVVFVVFGIESEGQNTVRIKVDSYGRDGRVMDFDDDSLG